LALLSALFGSGSKSGQVMAGLLLSTLIANGLFADDRDREEKAAAGISSLVEELLMTLPVVKSVGEDAVAEDVQAAERFMAQACRDERSFARILACGTAPCNDDGVVSVPGTAPVWSACCFALWFLVKAQTKPEKLVGFRTFLPILGQVGIPRVRWLAGEMLIQLHLAGDDAPANAGKTAPSIGALATRQEQHVVEQTMAEQVTHSLEELQQGLSRNRGVMSQQEELTLQRQEPLCMPAGGSWSVELDDALQGLVSVRERLSQATGSVTAREVRSSQSTDKLRDALVVDSGASTEELDGRLCQVQVVEEKYTSKMDEWRHFTESLTVQTSVVDQCSSEVKEADQVVEATRKRISEVEQEVSNKQREAQVQRTLASSDLTSLRTQLSSEVEEIDKKMAVLRAQAQKINSGEPAAEGGAPLNAAEIAEAMVGLKQEAAAHKARRAELQAELQRMSTDPASATDTAIKMERDADALQEQLNHMRSSELVAVERALAARRETWQHETTRMQEVRSRVEATERECSELKAQLAEGWESWRPIWSARLDRWNQRSAALSTAQVQSRLFEDTLNSNWSMLQEEQDARRRVMESVANVQNYLAELTRQIMAIGDL